MLNGDNFNDNFQPYFSKSNTPYVLTIFSKWGEIVFKCAGTKCGWDGTYQGKYLDPAVFVYVLEYSDKGEKTIKYGDITLMK